MEPPRMEDAASPDLGTPLLGVATQAKSLAAVLAGVAACLLLKPHFERVG